MKAYIVLLLTICISTNLAALDPPEPIEGHPMFQVPVFANQVGDVRLTVKNPTGWGVGDMHMLPEGSNFFSLYPSAGGYGLSYEFEYVGNEQQANAMISNLKKTFKTVVELPNGFEAVLKKSFYSCTTQNGFVVQTWYSLPKMKENSHKIWNDVKGIITLEKNAESFSAVAPKIPDINFPKMNGTWTCQHPQNKVELYFKPGPLMTVSANSESAMSHIFKFESVNPFQPSGYLFVKWDQANPDQATYEAHLEEMIKEVSLKTPSQKVYPSSKQFDLEYGAGLVAGDPYDFITIHAKGFLFGFAYTNKFGNNDPNDLINTISWVNK